MLSDPQERAWYDSHRDAILRNEDGPIGEHYKYNVRVTTAEDILGLFVRFHGRIDYSDSPLGFYSTIRGSFDVLAQEEQSACQWGDLEKTEYPSFGFAQDSYEDAARPFYAFWCSFATKKTFSWKDVYRYSEAPDRRVRRIMEKENKRFREEGIREFNDAVRSLVAFVRKRDPRYMSNPQTEADRQKILRDAAAAQAAKSRAANQAKLEEQVVPEWTKVETVAEQVDTEEEQEEEQKHVECVVCKKIFKSEKQYEAHEKSKKHVKAVQQLRREIQIGEGELGLDNANVEEPGLVALENEMNTMNLAETPVDLAGQTQPIRVVAHTEPVESGEKSSSSNRHSQMMPRMQRPLGPADDESAMEDAAISESSDEHAPRGQIEARILGQWQAAPLSSRNSPVKEGDFGISLNPRLSLAEENSSNSRLKLGKAKEKRAKRAAKKRFLDEPSSQEVGWSSLRLRH